ncbi:unnamed protein product [Closterium sp. NIES-53]
MTLGTKFGDEAERPHWAELLRTGVAIFDLDYDAILAAMYAPALGASESALPCTAPAKSLHTFTLDSGGSRCFFRDSTTLTPLSAPVPARLPDPSRGPVHARSSTVLPCLAVPSGSLSGLHLPSFSTILVSTAALHDAMVTTTTPGGSVDTPCSCRLLSHQTLLWHHRLGHPSLPRLRGMRSRLLVSGLPRSPPPLPPSPPPPCLSCVEGWQRAAPHSSSFPPTTTPLQTLHMDVWGPARVSGQGRDRYFLLVNMEAEGSAPTGPSGSGGMRGAGEAGRGVAGGSSPIASVSTLAKDDLPLLLPSVPHAPWRAAFFLPAVRPGARGGFLPAVRPEARGGSLPAVRPEARGGLLPRLKRVLLVPGLCANLLSTNALSEAGMKMEMMGTKVFKATLDGRVLWDLRGGKDMHQSMWEIPVLQWKKAAARLAAEAVRGGHASHVTSGEGGDGSDGHASKVTSGGGGCLCMGRVRYQVKFSRFPFHSAVGQASDLVELVHVDLVEKTKVKGDGGALYSMAMVYVDTRLAWSFPLAKKSDAARVIIEEWLPMVERESGKWVKAIRSDCGGEFLGAEFQSWLKQHSIKQQLTTANTPQSNGVAERANRTIMEGRRMILVDSGLPLRFLPLAIRHATVIKNWVLTDVRVAAVWAVHLGLGRESKGWLMWDPKSNTIFTTRDAKFMEGLMLKVWSERGRSKVTIPLGIDVGTNDQILIPIELSSSSEMTEVSYDLGGAEGGAADVEEVLQQGEAPVPERGDTEEEMQQPTRSRKLPPRRTTQGISSMSLKSKKQGEIAHSSMESEYMALFHGVKEVVWMRRLLEELGQQQEVPTSVFCDSQGAIAMARNAVLYGLNKHMHIKWHWVRKEVKKGTISLHYTNTTKLPADFLTKRLAEHQHLSCATLFGISFYYGRQPQGASKG